MPYPKEVKIADIDLSEVQGVTVSVETPFGPRGDYEGRTHCAVVTLFRRARNKPTLDLFKMATNEDGRLALVKGSITLESSAMQVTYTIEMEEAFIAKWYFSQPPDDDMLFETVELHVGKMILHTPNGGAVDYTVPEFSRFLTT